MGTPRIATNTYADIDTDFDPTRILSRCRHCQQRLVKAVKVLESGEKTHNHIGICINPLCHLGTDFEQLKTWRRM